MEGVDTQSIHIGPDCSRHLGAVLPLMINRVSVLAPPDRTRSEISHVKKQNGHLLLLCQHVCIYSA